METVKSLEESGSLIQGASETIENEAKEKNQFLGVLLDTLGASLLRYMLTGKGICAGDEAIHCQGQNTITVGLDF